MAKHQRAVLVPFSSVVGSSVTLHDPDEGFVVAQLRIMAMQGSGEEWKRGQIMIGEEVAKAINALPALKKVQALAEELCTAVDSGAEDIGGSRPIGEIIAELGPATDVARHALL